MTDLKNIFAKISFKPLKTFLIFAAILGLGACTTISDLNPFGPTAPEVKVGDVSAEKLYARALATVNNGSSKEAATQFEEVERQYPYSTWARRSMLMSAYAHYERNSFDDAINASKRFLALYPGNDDAPYAYYLIALSYYEQISDVGRDQAMTKKALAALDDLIKRYPYSDYSKDAEQKAILARDHLAGKEMRIGRYYMDKKAYVAAINRFKVVVSTYQRTSHAPEALMRLAEAYMALGVTNEAQTAAAILGNNFPDSKWYDDAYVLLKSGGLEPRENKGSWLSRAWNSITF
jgi:outer membrane protein assembly factor BamD